MKLTIPIRLILITLFLVLIIGPGCAPRNELPASPAVTLTSPAPTSTSSPSPSPTLEAASTPAPEEQTTPEISPPDRIQYDLRLELDYDSHQVIVLETITIPHPSSQPLEGIELVLPANSFPGSVTIYAVELGEDRIPASYQLDGVRMAIPLEDPWLPGEAARLSLKYRLDLPPQNARQGFGPSPFGYTSRQTNLVDWYAMVPPFDEEDGWVIHDPWLFGESLVYPAADFFVELSLLRDDLVVAATSLPEQAGEYLRYRLERARNFVFSISPEYQLLESDVNGTRVLGYYFPPYPVPAQAAFQATLEALALYEDLFGPYGQDSLSMVQADFNHGMEYEGLYFQSRGFFETYNGSEQSYLVAIAVHETAHQWWYGQVANDQALEPWLDEALCTFSELAYYEQLYPQSVDWWWGTRVNFYQPEGRLDRSIYGFQEYTDQYLAYRDATYLQGARFLASIKTELGEEKFYSFLRDYGETYRDQIASADDFFTLLEDYLDLQNLSWLDEFFPGRLQN